MYKTKIAITVGTAFLLGAASASYAAETTVQSKPLDQALESIDKNLAKDSDNKGLLNAKEHLKANQLRQEARAEKHTEKDELTEKVEQHEKAERPEKAERAEKAERPDISSVRANEAARPDFAARPIR
jgi:hypothetical protein